jgi:hypothetical protein
MEMVQRPESFPTVRESFQIALAEKTGGSTSTGFEELARRGL